MNKKVVLINRPLIRVKGFHIPSRKWPPLDLAYTAAIIEKQNIVCRIIDSRALDLSVEETVQKTKEFEPDLIIFATEPFDFYHCPNPNWQTIEETIKLLKRDIGVKILALGPQATLFDKTLFSELPIDCIIKGDNPLLAAEVALDLLKQGKTERSGVSYFNGNNFISGRIIPLEDLTVLPVPAYHLLPMDKYSSYMHNFPLGNFSVVVASRGCPFQCEYCFKGMITNKIRSRNLELVMEEIKVLIKDYKIKSIYFFDELFTFNRGRVIDLCDKLIKENYNIGWGCQTRIDFVDEELLKLMYGAGCRYISYGIETASQRISDLAHKNLNIKKAGEVIELTGAVGIFPHINMMYGFPDETKEDFNQTIDFMIKYCREDALPAKIDFYVGTPYYNEYLAGKSHQEAVEISQNLGLSKLKQRDVEKGIARFMLYRRWQNKKIDKMFFYFLARYLFPSLVLKLKSIEISKYFLKKV